MCRWRSGPDPLIPERTMLDAAFIREHLDEVKANCRKRNVKTDIDTFVRFDDERRRLEQELQTIQQRSNEVQKRVGPEKDPAKKEELKAEGKRLREEAGALEDALKLIRGDLLKARYTIPNMTHPDAPVGTTPEDNKVIRR